MRGAFSADTITVHTDGSCNPAFRVGGWAAIIVSGERKVVLTGHDVETTHQRMELMAVIRALRYIHTHQLEPRSVQVFTDSQYVINILASGHRLEAREFRTKRKAPVRNDDLVRAFLEVAKIVAPTLYKVKAHGADDLHREVDKLSRRIVRDVVHYGG